MNFRSSELTSGKLFPLHRPSTVMGMPERCSPARNRFAALTRVLACSAPFRRISTCDGRLRREHLSDSGSHQWSTKKNVDSAGLLMEVADSPPRTRTVEERPLARSCLPGVFLAGASFSSDDIRS